MDALTLVANPGSASRKYALFAGKRALAQLHFEYENAHVVCIFTADGKHEKSDPNVASVGESVRLVLSLLNQHGLLPEGRNISRIGLRVVAPTGYFLQHRVMNDEAVARLEVMRERAPLHVAATLQELHMLREQMPEAEIVGVSDSAFHVTKPDYAWNYGLPLADADQFEIKRFGYHGLSAASVVHTLKTASKLPAKLIICHLGSGASVTAVHGGKAVDTTMGYSPLEGLVMATRVGSIDATAARALKDALGFDDTQLEKYLNEQSGLLGLSGSSSDVRELLQRETDGDHRAHLALQTYVFNVQKVIGQMSAALGGVDMLVFTGTVGERSAPIRERITKVFHYLDFMLDTSANSKCTSPDKPTCISRLAHSRPIFVVPADEAAEIIRAVSAVT